MRNLKPIRVILSIKNLVFTQRFLANTKAPNPSFPLGFEAVFLISASEEKISTLNNTQDAPIHKAIATAIIPASPNTAYETIASAKLRTKIITSTDIRKTDIAIAAREKRV